jgi:hypothetical protein
MIAGEIKVGDRMRPEPSSPTTVEVVEIVDMHGKEYVRIRYPMSDYLPLRSVEDVRDRWIRADQ